MPHAVVSPLHSPPEHASELGERQRRVQEPEDAVLVGRALDGDRWAEEALYRRHVDAVAAMAARLLGRRAEAEDVVQDTFVVVLEQLGDLREPRQFRSWLLKVAVHQAHRRFRRRRLRKALGLDRQIDDTRLAVLAKSGNDPEVVSELARLDAALARLPAQPRIAWMLRYVEGMRLAEVASACGCSLATAKRRIARADARVRAHVAPEGLHA